MTNQVFANMMEVSCKQAAGKTICAFPDVCFTPPTAPPTPPGVPIPYPNTGMAADCTSGSSTVKISGQEVMLKNKSYFKKSTGDEAGCAPKKGMINSKITGKVYFTAWSMDVKVEGENAVRHLDLTTGNHASPLANESIPWPHVDTLDPASQSSKDCKDDIAKEKTACEDYKPYKEDGKDVCAETGLAGSFSDVPDFGAAARNASANPCATARRCRLMPFNASPRDGISGCCPAQTGDHIVPKSSFYQDKYDGTPMDGWSEYKMANAPCMCLEGGSNSGSHGLRHAHHKSTSSVAKGTHRSFDAEAKHCAKGAKAVAPECSEKCIEEQLKHGHEGLGDQSKPVKYSPTGGNFIGKVDELNDKISAMLPRAGVSAP